MSLFGNLLHIGSPAPAHVHASGYAPALEHIVRTFGSAITKAPRHAEDLEPAIMNAESYYARQVASIPGPENMTAQAIGRDALIDAMFPSADEVRIALGRSIEAKEAVPRLLAGKHLHAYALLGFRHRHGASAGAAPGFADHTVKCLASGVDEVRAAIRKIAFERLVQNFGEHVARLRLKGQLLKVEWNIENAPPAANAGINRNEFVHADTALAPDKLVRGLCAWLNDPGAHLRLVQGAERIALAGVGGAAGSNVELPLLHASDRRQWIVSLVRFPVHEAVEALARETRVHRYIVI